MPHTRRIKIDELLACDNEPNIQLTVLAIIAFCWLAALDDTSFRNSGYDRLCRIWIELRSTRPNRLAIEGHVAMLRAKFAMLPLDRRQPMLQLLEIYDQSA